MGSTKPETIRQAVFCDNEVRGCKAFLLELPNKILTAKEAIIELEVKLKYDTAVKDAKQAVTDFEVEVAYEVKNTVFEFPGTDDTKKLGKPIYTNEEQRKTETRRRLVKDELYVACCNQIKDALRAESVIKMDLGKAHARLAAIEAENHNLCAIAGMIAGLAHESTTTETHRILVKLGDNGNGN